MLSIIVASLCFSCASRQPKASEDANMPAPDAAYFFIRGYEAEMSHQWGEAEQFYRKALDVDPSSLYVRVQLGYVLYRQGNADEVLKLMEDILRDHPDNVQALKLSAEILRRRSNTMTLPGCMSG